MKRPLVVAITFAAILHAEDKTGTQIVRNAAAIDQQQRKLRQQYLYHDHQENGAVNADGSRGKVRYNRDFEVIFLEGDSYHRLVGQDGKPLKPKQAHEEDEKMRLTAAQRKARHLNARTKHSGVPLSAMLVVMDHQLLREEEIDGRKCWVVKSEPKQDAVAKTAGETQALSYRYINWIDEAENAVVRQDWEVLKEGVETKPGSKVQVVFTKNADGAWLPQRAEFVSVTGDKPSAARVFQTNVYSDYHKFAAAANIQFDETP